jgi:hypothetical protein
MGLAKKKSRADQSQTEPTRLNSAMSFTKRKTQAAQFEKNRPASKNVC